MALCFPIRSTPYGTRNSTCPSLCAKFPYCLPQKGTHKFADFTSRVLPGVARVPPEIRVPQLAFPASALTLPNFGLLVGLFWTRRSGIPIDKAQSPPSICTDVGRFSLGGSRNRLRLRVAHSSVLTYSRIRSAYYVRPAYVKCISSQDSLPTFIYAIRGSQAF
ncbi:hypothetical protein BDY21DRAFT_60037 [Lineolata rhizophorae]|uniref:Uncharacterized protein n=1 Tax=Lineolata rhizophorae TaxID=578093 RepID=A0A6A6NVJ7_9PEZI|nr:hypothetical protein BDY21DRAFT_60037 [Lineolata rhizophorae]